MLETTSIRQSIELWVTRRGSGLVQEEAVRRQSQGLSPYEGEITLYQDHQKIATCGRTKAPQHLLQQVSFVLETHAKDTLHCWLASPTQKGLCAVGCCQAALELSDGFLCPAGHSGA